MNWCSMFKSVVVKRDQTGKAKLSAYWLTCFPTFTYDKKQGVETEIIKAQIQAEEMSLIYRKSGLSIRNGSIFRE